MPSIVNAGSPGAGGDLRLQAAQKGIPLVFASRAHYLDDVDIVRPDNTLAAQMLTEHLIHRGHQRIAWLGGSSSSLTRAERIGGYCSTLFRHGLPFHSEWVVECDASQKQAADAIIDLLRHNPTISAVVCHNSVIAMGAWFGLMRSGKHSGEDGVESYYEQQVTLGAFADKTEQELDDIPLTWVTTPASEIGEGIAEQILLRIADGSSSLRHQVVSPRLIVRK